MINLSYSDYDADKEAQKKELLVYSHIARYVIIQAITDLESKDTDESSDANEWLFNDDPSTDDLDGSFKMYCDIISAAIASMGYDDDFFKITPNAIRAKILESSQSRKNILRVLKAHKINEGHHDVDYSEIQYLYSVCCENSIMLN